MASVGVSLKVDDRVMVEAVGSLGASGVKAASRRGVMKTARLGASELKAFTRAAMFNEPGGYDPFSPANFKRPRVRTEPGAISAGTGYTREGYIDRFRSSGTKPRYRGSGARHVRRGSRSLTNPFGDLIRTRDQGGGYTGIEVGFGMVQNTARTVDPLFPAIMEVEMVAEVKKRGL